jgi:hypothetical protein
MVIPIVAYFQQKSLDNNRCPGFFVIFASGGGIAKCWIRMFCWLEC